jgi:uncharacterized SAM-binding protein YcdF (DUF218 family)
MNEKNFKTTGKIKQVSLKILRYFFSILGIISFIFFILSFTDIPYYAYYNLSIVKEKLPADPDVIVVLGGTGMPSPDGLIRTYYAAEAANKYKAASIIIALPYNETDSLHQLNLMATELMIRGIDSSRITYEPYGFNTRSQALNIATLFEKRKSQLSLLLITSPEHIYRSVKAFRKAGFTHVGGTAAFERPVDEEKIKDNENTTDTRVKSLDLRYNMWSYLHYELSVAREYCAIFYYKLKGWI